MKRHPIQPLEKDKHGTLRFKENAIVNHLIDDGPFDMNSIACKKFSKEDREQFAQLIGYSLSGFGELSYVSDKTYAMAEASAEKKETDAVQSELEYLRERDLKFTKFLTFMKETCEDFNYIDKFQLED